MGFRRALSAGHDHTTAVFGSIARAAEEPREDDGRVRVRRVVSVVDCGLVVSPQGARAQIEAAMNFGLGAALMGEISIAGGRVEQSNFHDYRVLRVDGAPAMANSVFAATGK
jgi:isoquinoline 1-oxidoreductase subunit beta